MYTGEEERRGSRCKIVGLILSLGLNLIIMIGIHNGGRITMIVF
jgi:hypothetical protein